MSVFLSTTQLTPSGLCLGMSFNSGQRSSLLPIVGYGRDIQQEAATASTGVEMGRDVPKRLIVMLIGCVWGQFREDTFSTTSARIRFAFGLTT